jgi:SecD/SecF fusion protein
LTGKQNKALLIFILVLAVAAGFVAFSPKIKTYYGLDIRGGVRVVLRAKTEEYEKHEHKPWTPDKLEAVRLIMERRVNFSGVSEPVIITKPPDQLIIELPGLKDEKEALERIEATTSLQFYYLPQLGNKGGSRPSIWRLSGTQDPKTGAEEYTIVDSATGQPLTPAQLEDQIFSKDPLVTGKDLLPNSRAVIQGNGSPVIEFEFDPDGSRIFEEFTRAHIGDYLAVFLDKKLLTAPTIDNVIPGRGIIQGNFTLESAKTLSDQLNAGALPVPLENLETRKLEATLGAEAVKATTTAGIIGLILVLVFMLIWYRLPGVLANIALVLYTIFSFALFKLWPITLTLPGIAGFILSIGMAVDANILIFERLKEELRSGKTLRASIDAGFKRAFTAIFDSNVCTVMTCCVLYYFGTGPIRGFALTLGLGVLVSMFTAITVTRTFLFTLVGLGFAQNPAAYGLKSQWMPSLHVMRRKMLWIGLSLLIIVPGMIFWLGLNGIKKSIDFTGGTELQVPFAARHSADEIQRALGQVNPRYRENSRVVVSGGGGTNSNLAYVTTPRLSVPEREQVISALTSRVGPLTPGQNVAYSDVSGTISSELTINAIKAVLFASVLIVLYLAIRFAIGGFKEGLKYGTCAVIALLHDVLVVWGAFAILGYFLKWQVDSLFVTAMLTVIGFSVHDTIIVFDRVRENLQHRARGENFSDLTDRSIDQTISRSVKTSFTVVLVLLAMFFFGGAIIHQFVGALLIGIISGTYSSIFNASVLLVWWKQWDGSGLALAGAGPAGGAKSGLAARPAAPLPGDRPLVTPKSVAVPTPATEPSLRENASSQPGAPSAPPRPSTPRRQPQRRRRM